MNKVESVCVYCGSGSGRSNEYVAAGRLLGNRLAHAGLRLVYGGGTTGIMGAVAAGCLEEGGAVTGIIPRFLMNREATETALAKMDDLVVTDDMHQRKHIMFERSDAFVALPGGIGTLEEIVEIMTWAQLGRHEKPIVFANIDGFWDSFLTLMDHMKTAGFLHTAHLIRPVVVEDAAQIVPAISQAASRRQTDTSGDATVIERL